MFSSGLPSNSRRGIQICVESLNEWQVQDIGYDGVEKHIKPPSFKDVIAQNAQNILWREVVGNEASLDVEREEDEEEPMETDGGGQGTSAQRRQEIVQRVEPVAGPWAATAKYLHQSLQEINVLLDTLKAARTQNMAPLQVSTLMQDERRNQEQIILSKAFQFNAKKNGLKLASNTLKRAFVPPRDMNKAESVDRNAFFTELRSMRENWRIRKVGVAIYGDIGYRIFGPKFAPNELFDILRRPTKASSDSSGKNASCIQVEVPRNLMRRTALYVHVQIDTSENAANLFRKEDRSFMRVGVDQAKQVPWEKALKWAQDSLICKDIFAQLTRESVSQERICLAADNFLVVSLFDDILLKVEQRHFPFEDGPIPEEGISFLNRTLREEFVADQTKKWRRPQQFVSLAQTLLPESLDLRGPQALTAEEIASRTTKPAPLLNRLIDHSVHYVLVCKLIAFLQKYAIQFPDPQLQWKWIRCSPTFSMVSVVQTNRGFEHLGKLTSHIRVTESEVIVVNKEFQQINCRKDMAMVQNALMLLTANYLLNSVALLSRVYSWQTLHVNNNAFDADGNPTPTFYACNQSASKFIFVQFHTDGSPPAIYLKQSKFSPTDDKDHQQQKPRQDGKGPSEDLLNDGFRRLNYDRLLGTSLMRKFDCLLSVFLN